MHLHRLVHASRALAAAAWMLLALAVPAGAMPADNVRPRATHTGSSAPTVVRETVVRSADGPGTLGFVVIGVGAAAALLGAGYLGARIATRKATVRTG